jgi:hypothetical protein
MTARRFPPPWTVEEQEALLCRARPHNGQALSYVYYEEEPGRRSAAKLLVARAKYLTLRYGIAQGCQKNLGQKV